VLKNLIYPFGYSTSLSIWKQDRMAKWGTERYTIMFWVYTKLTQVEVLCTKLTQVEILCRKLTQVEVLCTKLTQVEVWCTKLTQVEVWCTKLTQVYVSDFLYKIAFIVLGDWLTDGLTTSFI
jgi:hypothetical protein